jgi:uncharacterized phage protein (TIGR02220 family)
MTVMRVNKTNNYTVMSNCHLRDTRLSLKAVGLLSKILSLPDNWDYSIRGLVAICKENETAVKNALKELKEFGYLKVTKLMPDQTESGRIEWIYDIYEQPQTSQNGEHQKEEKQQVENLSIEHQYIENRVQLNTKESNTEELNTDVLNTKDIYIGEVPEELHNAPAERIPYQEIIDYLNLKTNKHFRPNISKTRSVIKSRWKEGFRESDFKYVIDVKCSQWLNDSQMSKYLRPETLFGNKFESYLNEEINSSGDIWDRMLRGEV